MQLVDTPDTDYCFIFLDTPLVRWSIDGLTIAIFVENNSAPLFKNNLFFLCSNFVTINEIINEILKVESDFALEVWVSIQVKCIRILVGGFYKPPNNTPDYFELLKESIDRACNTDIINKIITGDFNCNRLNDSLMKWAI